MFSKLTLSLIVVLLTGCSYFFNNNDKEKNTYTLSISEKAGVSCLQGNTQLFKDYFDLKRPDTLIKADLLAMKSCVYSAVELFLKHTKGAQGNAYTTSEVHDFLSHAFNTYTYPIGFMDEVVRLKHSMIGGTPYTVTKSEITEMMVYVEFIYDSLAELSSQRHLLFSKRKGDDRVEFLKASAQFQKIIQHFNQLKRKDGGVFDYDSFNRLVGYITEDVRDNTTTWSKTLDLVNSLQALLSSGRRDQLNIQQFPFVVEALAQMYMGFLEYNKFVQDDDFFKDFSSMFVFPGFIRPLIKNHTVYERPQVVESMNHIQKNILLPFQKAVARTSGQKIAVTYFYELVDTLHRIGSLDKNLSANTLKVMIPDFFGRWLSSGNCGQNCKTADLTLENIDVLLNLVDQWKERQLWINAIGQKQKSSISGTVLSQGLNTQNLKALKEAILSINHIHWEDYLVIGSKELTYKDLVIFNSIYTLTTIFTRPFNENWKNTKTIDYYLTQDQTQSLYLWLRELGIDLKLVDPRSRTSGKSAFLEGNLFSSIGADSEKFNFPEILEYLEITFTTGHKSVSLMESQFIDCRTDISDVFEFKKLDALCFRDVLHKDFKSLFFSNMPNLTAATENMEEQDVNDLLNSLEKAARQGLIVNEPAETDTMRLVSSISQYSESLFLRFDADNNNKIDDIEFQKALTHIVPNVRKLIKENLEPSTAIILYKQFPDFEMNLISYIIRYKTIPGILIAEIKLGETTGIAALKAFKTWVDVDGPTWWDWMFSKKTAVVRSDILLVISGLSSFARANRIKAIKKIFETNTLAFDNTIKDINDPILEKLSIEIQCSTKKSTELKQWLISKQKEYWIKEQATGWSFSIPFMSDSKINIKTSDVPTSSLWDNWSGIIAKKMIELIYKEPTLSPYCGLPYVEDVQKIAPQQAPRRVPTPADPYGYSSPL